MKVTINGKEINLFVSVWVADENRLGKITAIRPDNQMLKIAAMLYICHLNYCRKQKTEPLTTIEEVEDWAEEQMSKKESRKILNALMADMVVDINQLFDKEETDETEQKKMMVISGNEFENLPLAKLG